MRSILDEFLPAFDAVERHATNVAAPPVVVMAAFRHADLGGPLVRIILALRFLPALLAGDARTRRRLRERAGGRAMTLQRIRQSGFTLLHEGPDALVLGITGRFWTLGGGVVPTDPATWADGPPPGTAQGAWSFVAAPNETGGTCLTTETRVRCADAEARRKFSRYWRIVQPGSGLLRLLMLRRIRREAERTPSRSPATTP